VPVQVARHPLVPHSHPNGYEGATVSPASPIHSLPCRAAAVFSYRRCRLSSRPAARRGAERSAGATADEAAAEIAGQSGTAGTSMTGRPETKALARTRPAMTASRSSSR